jgi:hypothetical protein
MMEWQAVGLGVVGALVGMLAAAARYGVSRRAVAAEVRQQSRRQRPLR